MAARERLADRDPADLEELRLDWRRESLVRAGYDERSALLVALRSEIDLHQAVDLVEGGCPVKTALRILL
jgi:hypothetical protein